MNRPIAAFWIVAGLACASAAVQAQQAAETPAPLLRPATLPTTSSAAVQAAEDARVPSGEMRPEKRPVPQVVLPLKRQGTAGDDSASAALATPGRVDDEVARCLASRDRRERAACRALTQGRQPSVTTSARAG